MIGFYTTYSSNFVENELYIKFNKSLTKDDISVILNKINEEYHLIASKPVYEFPFNKNNNSILSLSSRNNLSRIYRLVYRSLADSRTVAHKLSSMSGIDYSEAVPKRYFFSEPNDPLSQDQYYLRSISAMEAWDIFDSKDTVIVAVVDTGVDYLHLDLDEVVYQNNGETGVDQFGNDKRSNLTDDDNNGYIDDWRGWDFASSDTSGYDNDPYPGHMHGTHVSGIIAAEINNSFGIAGISPNVKILPVKVSGDSPGNRSIYNGYEGIIYAAENGADIINCSWGGPGYSEAESEIINAVVDLGVLVVGAAGNDGDLTNFYPASYDNVLSVTSVDEDDILSSFSNFSTTVDVSAPGTNIVSTIPENEFQSLSGTSMAAPVAVAVAALVKSVHHEYNVKQLIEHVKVSSDNIDPLQGDYLEGKIGTGRVNAFRAITIENPKSLIARMIAVKDDNSNNIYEPRETITVDLNIENVLNPVSNITITASIDSKFDFSFTKDKISIAKMNTNENIDFVDSIQFEIPNNIPLNYVFDLALEIKGDSLNAKAYITMTANPSYRTMDGNDIAATFNESGNLAFNDYPSNNQGIGFRYQNSSNVLYEGALIVASAPDRISNVARGSDQIRKDKSFFSDSPFNILKEETDLLVGGSNFKDNILVDEAGVQVSQQVYQYNRPELENILFIKYDILNTGLKATDSLFVGLFFDWDIGQGGQSNQISYLYEHGIGFCENLTNDTLPKIGVLLLNNRSANFFAIDNNGSGGENPGIYDGFDLDEKWRMISSGIGRDRSGITDVSMVLSGGPNRLSMGQSLDFVFCIIAGLTKEEIIESSKRAIDFAYNSGLIEDKYETLPKTYQVSDPYPNPGSGEWISFELRLGNRFVVDVDLYDALGKKILDMSDENSFGSGVHLVSFADINLPQGVYFLKIRLSNDEVDDIITKSIIIVK